MAETFKRASIYLKVKDKKYNPELVEHINNFVTHYGFEKFEDSTHLGIHRIEYSNQEDLDWKNIIKNAEEDFPSLKVELSQSNDFDETTGNNAYGIGASHEYETLSFEL